MYTGEELLLSGKDIHRFLLHRPPMLMVDGVYRIDIDRELEGYKYISQSEPWLQGHFPDNPVFPGVCIVECLAQATGILYFYSAYETTGKGLEEQVTIGVPVFIGCDNLRIKHLVGPGDRLDLKVSIQKKKALVWWVDAVASVGSKIVCKPTLMFSLTRDENS